MATSFDFNVRYFPTVIPNSVDLFKSLQQLPWENLLWGPQQVPLPRLCLMDVQMYPLGKILSKWLVDFFQATMGVACIPDGIFGNRYRNGNDYLPNHKDNYGEEWHVVSLSFGASRLFRFSKNGKVVTPKFTLSSGDLLIFSPHQNVTHTHGIPKQKQIREERINLTFFCQFEGDPYRAKFDKTKIPNLSIR